MIELVVAAADSKQAENITVLQIKKPSAIVDYLIILSADSLPQIKAIAKEVDVQLRKKKIKGRRWEGAAQSGWLLLDLGSIVVHIMGKAERAYYNLEELWGREAVVYHY